MVMGYEGGLVNTVLEAYNSHLHLVLRPDDVWISIMTAFSLYVNAHAEEMRHHFVFHEGKITLAVEDCGTMWMADWHSIIDRMSHLMDEKMKPGIVDWIVPNFTTSDANSRFVGKIVLMGSMQKYFEYNARFLCGIPHVTLLGTLEDWKLVKQRVDKLRQYGPIMEEMGLGA